MSLVINPNFDSVKNTLMHCENAVKCNKSPNVDRFIRAGIKYVFELTATNEILNVICTGKGFRAADMQIMSHYINGEKNPDEEQYTFSFPYESYDKIHFSSFQYFEPCNIYVSVDDMFA